jgi:tRNA threonylcarbamoyladenosine biosynthesis protein TsaE
VDSFRVTSHGPGQTARIASVLAARLRPGDAVLLTGDLAAGKTTFVKAVAQTLGSTDPVTSPTFALAQFYSGDSVRIMHVDAYRLADVAEYRDLALDEYAETSVSLIEWGEKIAEDFPCHLAIDFHAGAGPSETRTLEFSSACDRWLDVLADLHHDMPEEVR